LAAEPLPADLATLVQQMQERLARLEQRNAELEKRLAEDGDAKAMAARVEDVENEVLALRRQPKPFASPAGLTAGASLTLVAQRALSGTSTGRDESDFSYRADVEVEMPVGSIGDAEGKLFAHFRLGQGAGFSTLNPTLTGAVNSAAFELGNGGVAAADDSVALLAQAWYQLDIPMGGRSGNLGRLEVTVGKIDPFVFFDQNNLADDESEAFLNNVFVHNPLLDSGGDAGVDAYGFTPGLRVAYLSDVNGANNWGVSLGVFGSGPGASFDTSFSKPFVIGQVEYNGKAWANLPGAYRLYAWNNGRASDLTGGTERHSGWGISLDQQVAGHLSLFSRIGFSTQGQVAFDRAFTLGCQLSGASWGREKDRLGLAFGLLRTSDEYQLANPGFSGSEKNVELFYAWQLNDQVHIAPSLQWIGRPGGDPAAKDVTVLGLRAKVAY
jgi:high affinity Mn2+ porin